MQPVGTPFNVNHVDSYVPVSGSGEINPAQQSIMWKMYQHLKGKKGEEAGSRYRAHVYFMGIWACCLLLDIDPRLVGLTVPDVTPGLNSAPSSTASSALTAFMPADFTLLNDFDDVQHSQQRRTFLQLLELDKMPSTHSHPSSDLLLGVRSLTEVTSLFFEEAAGRAAQARLRGLVAGLSAANLPTMIDPDVWHPLIEDTAAPQMLRSLSRQIALVKHFRHADNELERLMLRIHALRLFQEGREVEQALRQRLAPAATLLEFFARRGSPREQRLPATNMFLSYLATRFRMSLTRMIKFFTLGRPLAALQDVFGIGILALLPLDGPYRLRRIAAPRVRHAGAEFDRLVPPFADLCGTLEMKLLRRIKGLQYEYLRRLPEDLVMRELLSYGTDAVLGPDTMTDVPIEPHQDLVNFHSASARAAERGKTENLGDGGGDKDVRPGKQPKPRRKR